MAFSVEGRYPFLDHRLIELCLSLAPSLLYRRGWTKEPLREALRREGLPRTIVRRRDKRGFETPQDRWLRGPLAVHWRALLEEAGAPVWEWAERDSARALAGAQEGWQVLFRLWMLDRWLRRFF
jgi:asparagine synthase (glutamine-hydrolysing)